MSKIEKNGTSRRTWVALAAKVAGAAVAVSVAVREGCSLPWKQQYSLTIHWVDSVYPRARLIVNVDGTTRRYPIHADWAPTGIRSPEKFVLRATSEGYGVSFTAEFGDQSGVIVAKARSATQDQVSVGQLPLTKKACQLNSLETRHPVGTVVYSIEPDET